MITFQLPQSRQLPPGPLGLSVVRLDGTATPPDVEPGSDADETPKPDPEPADDHDDEPAPQRGESDGQHKH